MDGMLKARRDLGGGCSRLLGDAAGLAAGGGGVDHDDGEGREKAGCYRRYVETIPARSPRGQIRWVRGRSTGSTSAVALGVRAAAVRVSLSVQAGAVAWRYETVVVLFTLSGPNRLMHRSAASPAPPPQRAGKHLCRRTPWGGRWGFRRRLIPAATGAPVAADAAR